MRAFFLFILLIISILVSILILEASRIKTLFSAFDQKDILSDTTFKIGRIRNAKSPDIIYDYISEYSSNYLVINLSKPDNLCFKAQLGLKNDIGAKADDGKLIKEFIAKPFLGLITDNNSRLGSNSPKAAFNTAFFRKTDNAPFDFNFIQGLDYSITRNWTSMSIDRNNKIEFIREKKEDLYNVAGGGPKVISESKFDDPCLSGALQGDTCSELDRDNRLFTQRRTLVGITEQNYMIVVASENLSITKIPLVFNAIAEKENTGFVVDANMFDGGGSVSLAFDDNNDGVFDNDEIKISGDDIVAAMLIYTGDACDFR